MRVNELSGALLDYWVLRAEGWVDDRLCDMQLTRNGEYCIAGAAPKHAVNGNCWRSPSTDWAVGGPLIDREGISVMKWEIPNAAGMSWTARNLRADAHADGPTPLIAAMRLFVQLWFGEEVPDV